MTFVYASFAINFTKIRIFTSMYEMFKFQGKLYTPLSVFENVYSNQLLLKLIKNYRNMRLFSSMSAGMVFLGHISPKILHYKLNKNEAFYLHGLWGASLGHQCLKILSYKLHKHETFHLNESGDGTLSCLLEKNPYCNLHKCNMQAFRLYVPENGYSGFSFQKILYTYFPNIRLFTYICLHIPL